MVAKVLKKKKKKAKKAKTTKEIMKETRRQARLNAPVTERFPDKIPF